jgi:hypothetical protein
MLRMDGDAWQVLGIVTRIAEFNEVLDEHLAMNDPATPPAVQNGTATSNGHAHGFGEVGFQNFDLVTPAGECLAKNMSVR